MTSFDNLSFSERIGRAAAIEFGKHRPSIFVRMADLQSGEMPEYTLLVEPDVAHDGYWVTIAPIPKRERSIKIHYGDPGDEQPE